MVTRRPGEPDYRLYTGGNTRLKILKELFAETGERRFARLACWYRAWRDEAEVVLAHLKENDLRGDLIFRDKALAVANAERWLWGNAGKSSPRRGSPRHWPAPLPAEPGAHFADEVRGRAATARDAEGARRRAGAAPGDAHPEPRPGRTGGLGSFPYR